MSPLYLSPRTLFCRQMLAVDSVPAQSLSLLPLRKFWIDVSQAPLPAQADSLGSSSISGLLRLPKDLQRKQLQWQYYPSHMKCIEWVYPQKVCSTSPSEPFEVFHLLIRNRIVLIIIYLVQTLRLSPVPKYVYNENYLLFLLFISWIQS